MSGEKKNGPGEFPVAIRRDASSVARYGTHFWWLTLASVVVAVTLVVLSWDTGGLEITVRFQEGHGLKPGDALRHKDIDIGRVTAAELFAVGGHGSGGGCVR